MKKRSNNRTTKAQTVLLNELTETSSTVIYCKLQKRDTPLGYLREVTFHICSLSSQPGSLESSPTWAPSPLPGTQEIILSTKLITGDSHSAQARPGSLIPRSAFCGPQPIASPWCLYSSRLLAHLKCPPSLASLILKHPPAMLPAVWTDLVFVCLPQCWFQYHCIPS